MSKCQTIRVVVVLFSLLMVLALSVGTFAQPVELTLWVNCWAEAIPAVQRAADVFANNHPSVSTVYVQDAGCAGDHFEKLTVAVAAGAAPDVVTMAAPFAQVAMSGLLLPLDSHIDQSPVLMREDYPPYMLASFGYEGKEYGVPAIEAALGLILVYSKDLFAQSGLPDRGPETLDELYDMQQKLTRLHPSGDHLDQVGINPMDAMGGFYFPLIWGTVFDVNWFDESSAQLDMLAFEDAMHYLKQIYDVPGYDRISASGFGGWTTALASGRVAMQVNGSWMPGSIANAGITTEFGYSWVPSTQGDRATASSPWGLGIPVNAPHPDLSFELIEFFSTTEALQIVFDGNGWLNGNLEAIRNLDISQHPEIAPIIGMLLEADRLLAPPPIPIMTDIYNVMEGQAASVFRGEQDARLMLETLQHQLQTRLDDVMSSVSP